MSFFLVLSAFYASFNLVQNKETAVTGSLTTNEDSGLRCDLGISNKQENFEIGGSVYGDSQGNTGVKVGINGKFQKRSAP